MIKNGSLAGKIAVVSGATRHEGRGIAIELGIAGATVYCTGRTTRSNRSTRTEPGAIDETAELVRQYGGNAEWVQLDHTDIPSVEALVERVAAEHGRLDLLVNAISGKASNDPFLQSDLSAGLEAVWQGGKSHIIATRFAAQRMVAVGSGLIVSISDHEWDQFYAIEKAIFNRLVTSVAEELRPHGVAMVAVLPGAFFHCFDVMNEDQLRQVVVSNPKAARCHTPRLIGRAVVALAADPEVMSKAGRLLEMSDLISEYGFTDIDGRSTGEMW